MYPHLPLRILTVVLMLLISSAVIAQPGAVSPELLKQYQINLTQDEALRARINAVTNNDIKSLSLNRDLIGNQDDLFNVKVTGTGIINQRSTGRCWMFAGANVVTPKVMTALKLSDFQLSESYLAFFDKLEKANRFLESIIALRDKPIDDRSLQMYIEDPIGDGGWWHYFTGLAHKYGIVPASVMPETKQSSSTGMINNLIKTLLRKDAAELRQLASSGKNEKQLRERKEVMLGDIYDLLVYAYGPPPESFTFRWEEGEDSLKTTTEKRFTPRSFLAEFFGESMPEYVAIVNNPAEKMNQLYELEGSRNIEETQDMRAINLPIGRLKHYALKSLVDSQLVWFACDVGKDNYNDSGIFAINVYDYATTLGKDFSITKADRIRYMDMSPNHAMVLTAVDTTEQGAPRKWRVENSWGTDRGAKGYWTMYDGWFDEWVLLVIVDKRLLEPDDLAILDQRPVLIKDWQPFFLALRNLELR